MSQKFMKKQNKSHIHKVNFNLELLKNPYKGTYICIEGIDGSGKSTQVRRLTKYLESQGKKVIHTREPRKKGVIGDLVHKVLLGSTKMDPKAIQYLFAADRVLHYNDVIVPELKKGNTVISDRCFWSAPVYGIVDRNDTYKGNTGNQLLVALSILSMYHQFFVPDYNIFLDISLKTSLSRLKAKDDQKEIYEEKAKIEKVIQGYQWLIKEFKEEFILVDGERPEKEVTEKIIEIFEKKKK
jgi:dTMP kinase